MNKLNGLDIIVLILIIIGALNWGLVGIFNFDLVATIFGDMSNISRVIYAVVGVSGLYAIWILIKGTKSTSV